MARIEKFCETCNFVKFDEKRKKLKRQEIERD